VYRPGVQAFACAGVGFLVAVVWFDLMFDVQVLRHREGDVPEVVLASTAAYYRRVTTDAAPMNLLVAVAMLGTLAAVVVELFRDLDPSWTGWASLALLVVPILLAQLRTVPNAVKLGSRADPVAVQSTLARVILRDHLVCIGALVAVLIVQLISVL
jgi:RsiW-degrading membrane proteinase PrsW (M82 family)